MNPFTPTDIPLTAPPGFLYLLDPLPPGWIDWLWQVIAPFLGG